MITKLLSNVEDTADKAAFYLSDPLLVVMRLYWGWQFMVAGYGKLSNIDKTTAFFADLGLPLPKLQVILASSTECIGGFLLLIGLFSRLVSVPLIFTMGVAYLTAHRETVTGIFGDSDAFVTAPPFLFLLTAVIVFVFGPGKLSADALLRRKSGT